MKFNINNIRILTFIFSFSSLVQASVKIDPINQEKIKKYKVEISHQIIRDKILKYIFVGASAAVLFKASSKWIGKEQALNTNPFSNEEAKKLKDLISQTPAVRSENIAKVSFFKRQWNSFKENLQSDVIKALFADICIRTCWNTLADQFKSSKYNPFSNHNIWWIMNKTNIFTTIAAFKENAVNLDSQSESLSLNELSKFNDKAKLITTNPLTDKQKKFFLEHANLLSNKILDDAMKIIAFLKYKEDELISNDRFDSLQNLRFYITQLEQETETYQKDTKSILEQLNDKKVPTKSLLTTIMSFNYALLELVNNAENYLATLF